MADSKPESSTRLNSTRRRFLAATACGSLAAGGLAAGPLRCWPLPTAGSVLGANERVRLGFIGVGWKGRHTMNVCKSFRDRVEHFGNFLDCIESREKPASDVEIGHRSTSTAHLINIALKRRETIHWDARNERITNSREANAMLEPNYRSPWQLPL